MQSNSWSVFVSQKPNCFSLKSFCVSEHWNISTVSDHLDKWDDVWFSFSRCDCLLTSSRFARRPWSSGTRSRWTEQQSQQHDSAAPVCLDPAVSTRHHDSTQNPNTHTERQRDAAAAGQLSLKLLFFFFFWGFKHVVIQQIHCRTWELMDWRSSSDGSLTRTWTWKSFKVFYKTKTWSL